MLPADARNNLRALRLERASARLGGATPSLGAKVPGSALGDRANTLLCICRRPQPLLFLEFVLGKSNAKQYLLSGAAAIGRKSISSDAELLALHPYLPLLNIPAGSRIERYPQIRVWPEFEKAVLDALPAMLNGEVEIQAGLEDGELRGTAEIGRFGTFPFEAGRAPGQQ